MTLLKRIAKDETGCRESQLALGHYGFFQASAEVFSGPTVHVER